jgi:hypothetical protein
MIDVRINQQKPADKIWADESGQHIPFDRIKQNERLNERQIAGLAKAALKLHKSLSAFKEEAFEIAQKLYDAFVESNGGKAPGKGKGNITLYNFDRSLKVEVSVHEQIVFDEGFIQLAKTKIDEILEDGLSGAKDFVKPLVMDAFSRSGGQLDTKRVLALRKYEDRIRDPRYAEAMKHINNAIRRPSSRQYFRVWAKDAKGDYKDIQLNFSSI